jgi:hypothetical protein
VNPRGEEYLERLPAQSHRALAQIRAFVLRVTQDVLRRLAHSDSHAADAVVFFPCR